MFLRLVVISFVSIIGLATPGQASGQCCLDRAEWAKFHNNDVQKWSDRSGLSGKTIQAILDSIDEDGPGLSQYLIQRIDTRSLSSRGQILVALTDFGTAHWLSVWVVQAKRPYTNVWHTASIRENGACPEVDLGSESMLGEATASATTNGELLIKIPENRNENGNRANRKTQLLVATYVWTAKTYRLKSEDVFTGYRWNGDDYVTHGRGTLLKCAQAPFD